MKQIIPFKKDLLLKTKVSEITSISLEHNYKIIDDMISGKFNILGDYKMTDGSINREKFDFELPFDITLDSKYKKDSLIVDIDNFYYKIVNDDTLEVNIDLFIDGEKEENNEDNQTEEKIEPKVEEIKYEDLVKELEENKEDNENRNIDYNNYKNVKILEESKETENKMTENIANDNIEIDIKNNNINNNENTNKNEEIKEFNIFDNVGESETYKAYYIYIVKDDDNLEKILNKYEIDKEELSFYNDIENIKTGDKIIIPSKNE